MSTMKIAIALFLFSIGLHAEEKSFSVKELDKRAIQMHQKKDFAEEARALELIRIQKKASPNQLTRLGIAYGEMKKKTEAIEAFKEVLQTAPKYEKAYRALYDFYVKINDVQEYRHIVMEALDKLGPKKEWMNDFCRIEYEQKYYEDAKNICQQAIEKDPKKPENHMYLALSFKLTNNEEQARKMMFKAAEQFQHSEIVQKNAGQFAEEIKNWELAQKYYSQCVRTNKESGACYLQWAKALFQLKEYDKSLKAYLKACPYERGVNVEIRRSSYELEKSKHLKEAAQYSKKIDKCDLLWFENSKKLKK